MNAGYRFTTLTGFVRSALVLCVLLIASVQPALAGGTPKPQTPVLTLSKASSIDTVQSGVPFSFTLNYTCSSANSPANDVVITDTLPLPLRNGGVTLIGNAQVASTSYNAVTGVAVFTMVNPLPAGSAGSVQINLMFPEGITPNLTVACNKATMSSSNAGSVTSNQVCVVAKAVHRFTFTKEVLTGGNLNGNVTYRLRVFNPAGNNIGGLNLNAATISDVLPAGSTFVSASPAPASAPAVGSGGTVTWNVGTLAVSPWYNQLYYSTLLTVNFPSPPFNANQTVCNQGCLNGTPVGLTAISLCDTACVTLVPFVAAPGATLFKGPWWSPMTNRVPGCNGYYSLNPTNTGNTPLDSFKVTDVLPTQVQVTSFSVGSYNNFPGGQVTIRYRTNVNAAWQTAGTYLTNTTVNVYTAPLNLPSGQYITQLQWDYGTVPVGFSTATEAYISFTLLNNSFMPPFTAVAIGDTITNCATLNSKYLGNPRPPVTSCKQFVVAPFAPLVSTYKNVISTGPYFPGDTVRYQLYIWNQGVAPLNNVVITDVLPAGMQYAGGVTYAGGNGAPSPATLGPSITNAPLGTVIWNFTSPFPNAPCTAAAYYYIIEFNAVVTIGTPPGTVCNTFSVASSNHATVSSNQACIVVNSVPTVVSEKQVKGALDAVFSATGSTVSGGAIDYKLTITNTGNVTMKDIKIVDILPWSGGTGDVGVINWGSARGSQFTPSLIGSVTAPPGVSVFYSIDNNPCRNDLSLTGLPGGCTTTTWYTYAGLIGASYNATNVRSLKFDFGTLQLAPAQSFTLTWPMTAPIGAVVGDTACNSFGYVAKRLDNNVIVGPAEPMKVCAEIMPASPAIYGDRVWHDANQNGIQDAGEPGLNGVMVELWNAGVDGIQGTPDDSLAKNNLNVTIPFVMTANNILTQPGYYQFSNLQPGVYYAKFFPTPGFVISLQNQGGNPQLDSDADPVFGPTYGWTGLDTLAAGDIDTTHDAGLYFREQMPCDKYKARALPMQGTVKCCYYVGFTMDPLASFVTVNVLSPNTISSATPPTGWTATPSGGVYPAPGVTYTPPGPVSGQDTSIMCFNAVINPVTLIVKWYDAQGLLMCQDTVRVDCKVDTTHGNTGGVKFHDINGDGHADPGEPGIADWPISLFPVGGGQPITVLTDRAGRFQFKNVPAGSYYMVEEQRVGWTQTSPPEGVYSIIIPPVDTLPHDFGNTVPPCKVASDTISMIAGTVDQFQTPEASVIGPDLVAWNNTNYGLSTIGFDNKNGDQKGNFFGHTFTGFAKPGCWILGARLTIRMRATGWSSANDMIGFVNGAGLVWGHSIAGISSNGFWTPGQTETIILDLGALPIGVNGATSALAALASGSFNIFVQNHTDVDWVKLDIYVCCPEEQTHATLTGVKFHDLNCDGKWDPATEPTLPNWTINLSNGQSVSTNNAGVWTMTVPAPGSYTVTEANVYPWTQSFPTNPANYTVTVVPGQTIGNLNFGNCLKDTTIDTGGGTTGCDTLSGAHLDSACCQQNFTVNNVVGTPITSISWYLTGGTLSSMIVTPCTPLSMPAFGSTSGVLTFSPACPGPIGFTIDANPTGGSGIVSITLVIHHGDKDSCLVRMQYKCEGIVKTRCDSMTVKPFVFVGLDLSGRTFTVFNLKIPASPIIWIDIKPTPPPAFLQGGGLVIDGIGTSWSVPYLRVPLAGLISSSNYVKFNLGVDYTLGWTGTITLVVHHADGDSCTYTYGPWKATPPNGGGGVLTGTSFTKRVYATRLKLKNNGGVATTKLVKWVSVQVVNAEDRIVAGSGKSWDGTVVEQGNVKLSGFEQGQSEALFEFDAPVRVGGTSDFFNIVVSRDSAKSGAPILRWTSYDEDGNALATDTVGVTNPVLSVRGDGQSVPEGFSLLSSFPNPAIGSATVNYSLSKEMDIRLEVFNSAGEYIGVLDQGFKARGLRNVHFDTAALPAGTYYLRLSSGDQYLLKSMVIVK